MDSDEPQLWCLISLEVKLTFGLSCVPNINNTRMQSTLESRQAFYQKLLKFPAFYTYSLH